MGTFTLTKEQIDAHREARRAKQAIALGERHVELAGFTGPRLVTLMDALMQAKEADALASKPKLVATYSWLQTVKGLAVAGQTVFPPCPHSFEEVIAE